MIKIYTVKACYSSNKAKKWLRTNGLKFEEIDLHTDEITFDDFLKILSLTEEGTSEVISKKSRAYKYFASSLERMSLHELVRLIDMERTLLRRPLIIDDMRLQVGYNEDDIRQFLPRRVRRVAMRSAVENIYQWNMERELRVK